MKNRFAALTMLPFLLLPAVVSADEKEDYEAIVQLVKDQKLTAAETALAAAIKAYPESDRISRLLRLLYSSAMRSGDNKMAARTLGQYLEKQLASEQFQTGRGPLSWQSLASDAGIYQSLTLRTGNAEAGKQMLEKMVAKLETADETPASAEALLTLRVRQAMNLRSADQLDAAMKLVGKSTDQIQKLHEADPENIAISLLHARAMQRMLSLVPRSDAERRTALENEHGVFIEKLLEQHPANSSVVTAYISSRLSYISGRVRTETEQAEKSLEELRTYLDSLDGEDPQLKRIRTTYARSIASLTRSVAAARKHLELIGQPAFALDPTVETWVNGDAITDADLKGKVVLLDFWAVWCGPCIATFPHLREWHEKYHDQGFEIVGVTRYYNYAWDETTGRAKRATEEVPPADEDAMLIEFAKSHELQHRFLVTNKASQLNQQYGVTGIPQAVLIGRDGRIRMIRVGSGSQNAAELDKMLHELLEEKVPAAD